MKRFTPVPEPTDWQAQCVARGVAWLSAHRDSDRPEDYWTGTRRKFRRHLRDGVGGMCTFTVLPAPNGQMDHFEPWARLRGTARESRAYEWKNFRYACEWFNKAKGSTPMPDPYTVGNDWFELRLPDLVLAATPHVPPDAAQLATNALGLLANDDRAVDARTEWFKMYREGVLSLRGLRGRAPMIADALLRQPEYLLDADREPAPS